ncbi:MAG: Chagasin family peptidase inhibitor I42 [Candidatus Omnitrophica bacterium ADurb.Bin205]|nr:MAG: Chagasin family peptidase inhibitor I42 [Candidatus Omnitrophica bacterium ADurb.Bin205]
MKHNKSTGLSLFIFFFLLLCFPMQNQAGETEKVYVGNDFSIVLESNPTTGYSWQLSSPPEKELISLINSYFETKEGAEVGASGRQVWVFKALKTGKANIHFKYVRPWEDNMPVEREKSFTVDIREEEPSRVRIGGDITITSVNRKGFIE